MIIHRSLVTFLALSSAAACTSAPATATSSQAIEGQCDSSNVTVDPGAFINTGGTNIGGSTAGTPPSLGSQEALLGALTWVWLNDNDAASLLDQGITQNVDTMYGWSAEYLDIISQTLVEHPGWGSPGVIGRFTSEIGRVRNGLSRLRSAGARSRTISFTVTDCEYDDQDPNTENPEEIELDSEWGDADVVTGPGEDLYATNLDGEIDFGNYGSASLDGGGSCDAGCDAGGWDFFDIGGGVGGESFDATDVGIAEAMGGGSHLPLEQDQL